MDVAQGESRTSAQDIWQSWQGMRFFSDVSVIEIPVFIPSGKPRKSTKRRRAPWPPLVKRRSPCRDGLQTASKIFAFLKILPAISRSIVSNQGLNGCRYGMPPWKWPETTVAVKQLNNQMGARIHETSSCAWFHRRDRRHAGRS